MAQAEVASRGPMPWSERLYEAAGVAPAWVGAGVFVALSALFLAVEVVLGRHRLVGEVGGAELRDVRLAFLCFLLVAYAPTAHHTVVRGTRRRLQALLPLFDESDAVVRRLAGACGCYARRARWMAGLTGAGIGLLVPFLTQGAEFAYRPATWSPEVVWHRITAPFIGWWVGRLLWAMVVESARFSTLATRIPRVDLLDLRALAPFARQGLANALAGVVFIAILAPSLLEAQFGRVFALAGGASFAACLLGLLLPVRGVHRRIRAAKRDELDWLRPRVRGARARLATREPVGEGLADLLAWQRHVESVPDWPFDAPMLWRAALYLLIPLGSWAGGALVERLVDAVLG